MNLPYSPLLLILLAFYSCNHRVKTFNADYNVIADLSDICEKIITVPLETNAVCKINDIKHVERTDTYIFLLNDKEILRFNPEVNFVNKIKPDHSSIVRSFTVNTANEKIIALDSLKHIHVFSFNGLHEIPWI